MKFTARKERRDRDSDPGKGTWRPFHDSAVFGCAACGFILSLLGVHKILNDGLVVGAVRCPAGLCGFKATLTLEGWDIHRDPNNPSSAFVDLTQDTDSKP